MDGRSPWCRPMQSWATGLVPAVESRDAARAVHGGVNTKDAVDVMSNVLVVLNRLVSSFEY